MKLTKLFFLFLFLSIKGFSQQAVLTSSGEKVILNFLSSSGGTISGTLGVTGNTTISGTTSLTGVNNTGTITNTGALINTGNLTLNGNGTISGTLGVTGNTTISGTLTTGTVTYPNTLGTNGQTLTISGTALTWTTPADQTTHTISETFGGGIVFYVTTDGLHGLIAETVNQSNTIWDWELAQEEISKSENHSTEGKKFTDWRLPTKYELSLMYIARSTIGGFSSGSYWSSTNYDNGNAWSQSFSNGGTTLGLKSNAGYVRAIRAF